MKATPQFKADLDEYPELGPLVNAVIRNVVEIMEVHDIGSIRRFRKDGVFGRPYVKDTVLPLGVRGTPVTVAAAREPVGEALLDYLEAVGITGLAISATPDELAGISALWAAPNPAVPPQARPPAQDPVPVAKDTPKDAPKPAARKKGATPVKPEKEARKDQSNGQAKG